MIARYARLSLLAALVIAGVLVLSGARLWGRDEGRLPAANPRLGASTPAAASTAAASGTPGASATPASKAGVDPVTALRKSLEQDPKNAGTWRDLGRVLAERKDYPGAAEAFAAAVEISPDDARMRNDLGSALLYLGLVRVARAQFERSVAIDGAYPDARFNLALTLSHVQPPDIDRALQEWRRVVEMAPGTEVAKLAQGYIDDYSGANKPGATQPGATQPGAVSPHGTPSATPTRPGGN